MPASAPAPLELWGGVECTVNRVGDRYLDQLRLSGHHERASDLELFAELGITALRYPVVWERTRPDPTRPANWHWSDARLSRLRALGIRPIVGLVHHGSGPRHTHLLDDGFASGLADHAGAVAARYPWVEDWTPVNEPLTTARFSALYGHWYPHATDERDFWLALVTQIDATRLAMAAIQRVTPTARLIATDDLGRTTSTPPLAAQAEYDNQRRWAGWDLLFGRVDRHHPLFDPLARLGLGDRLRRIADDPCPPDIVGVNHYLTSDRFLDHRLDRYPVHLHGSNGRETYADTEAVRVLDPPPGGFAGALREAWDRYRTPLALTEVHNGSTRDEQLRWAAEAWDAADALRDAGADIRAVTAWALLGSHGWNTLLTADGCYEPGVFDVSTGVPRATALAALWRGLPTGAPRHPVADEPGWWRRPSRLLYAEAQGAPEPARPSRPLLIWGDDAAARLLAGACAVRGLTHRVVERSRSERSRFAIEALLATTGPWGVTHPALPILAEACAGRTIACLDTSGIDSPAAIDAALDRLIDDAVDPASLRLASASRTCQDGLRRDADGARRDPECRTSATIRPRSTSPG